MYYLLINRSYLLIKFMIFIFIDSFIVINPIVLNAPRPSNDPYLTFLIFNFINH